MLNKITSLILFTALFAGGCSQSPTNYKGTPAKNDRAIQLTLISGSNENSQLVFDEIVEQEQNVDVEPFKFHQTTSHTTKFCVKNTNPEITTDCIPTLIEYEQQIILSGALYGKNKLDTHLSVIRTIISPKEITLSGSQTASYSLKTNNDEGIIMQSSVVNQNAITDIVNDSLTFKYQVLN